MPETPGKILIVSGNPNFLREVQVNLKNISADIQTASAGSESLKKLKGIWTKAGGIDFKSDKELTAWRRSLWASTNVRLNKKIRG